MSSVDKILNAVCAATIPTGFIASEKNEPLAVNRSISNSVKNTAVPITFTDVCAAATRFAFLLPPRQDISAVMQVPMFCPMIIGKAVDHVTAPVSENACKMPTDADDD